MAACSRISIFEVDANNVNATLANASNPGRLQPMPEVSTNDGVSNRGDADAFSGKNRIASRPMVLGSAMRPGERGVPAKLASLALRGQQGSLGEEFGFLGDDDIGHRPAEHGMFEGLPRFGIRGFNGPEPFGDPPSLVIDNGAKRVDAVGIHRSATSVRVDDQGGRGRTSLGPGKQAPAIR